MLRNKPEGANLRGDWLLQDAAGLLVTGWSRAMTLKVDHSGRKQSGRADIRRTRAWVLFWPRCYVTQLKRGPIALR